VAVYDGSFNTRFNLAVRGKCPRGTRGSKGGVRRSVSSFGLTVVRPQGSPSCGKRK